MSNPRHARDYWLDKQAQAAAKLAKQMRPPQQVDLDDDPVVVTGARGLVLLQVAQLLLLAEQMDRHAQRLKP